MDDLEKLRKAREFLDEIVEKDKNEGSYEDPLSEGRINLSKGNKFTPGQKLVLSIMLFGLILIAGFFILLVTQKIVLAI